MAIFGFCIGSFGLSWQGIGPSRSIADFAIMTSSTSKLFKYAGWGGSTSRLLLSACRTGRFQEIPDTDSSNRSLPLNWGGKFISLTVPGGFYFERKSIKLTIRNSDVSQEVLYEWEGFLTVRAASPGNIVISGRIRELSLSDVHNRRNFDYIMESGNLITRHTPTPLETL